MKLTTTVKKNKHEYTLDCNTLQEVINEFGDEVVLHCFHIGASQQFYRHIVKALKIKSTKKQNSVIQEFNPSAPKKKTAGSAFLAKMTAEERLVWAAEVQDTAIKEINDGVPQAAASGLSEIDAKRAAAAEQST